MELPRQVQEMIDREAIRDCLRRYTRGLDRRDLKLANYITNTVIDLDGDTAHAEAYYIIAGRKGDSCDTFFGGARYIDRLERDGKAWKIVAPICMMERMQNQEEAAAQLPLSHPVSRDKVDPSWDRRLEVKRPDRIAFGPGSGQAAHFQ